MRRAWLIICFLVSLLPAVAQRNAGYDSSAVEVRSADAATINDYKKQKQFQYDRQGRVVLSPWDRFWIWFWATVDKILSSPAGRNTVNVVLVLLGIAVVVFFILKLTGDRTGLFGGKGGKGLPYQVSEEDIHSISFEDAIREALAARNYRLAVRLIYLMSLKELSDGQIIDWKPGKTNTAYVAEVEGHPAATAFQNLTKEFETAWYGGEDVSQEHYQEIDLAFVEFKSKLRL